MSAPLTVAFVTGLVGTIHCAAMCGPLVAAGGGGGGYFAGRLLSYAAVGALLGTLGQHALCVLPMDRAQLLAVALVAAFAAWKAFSAWRRPRAGVSRPIALGRRRQPLLGRLLARMPRRGLGLGLATGILPCGMLVPAWVLATGAGSGLGGAAVMAAFWAGSSPGLLAPLVARRLVPAGLSRHLQGAAWAALALWTVARPLLTAIHCH